MDLSFELSIKQAQKLILTPEMLQSLKILQFSGVELYEYVQNEIENNPILEASDEPQEEVKIEPSLREEENGPVDWNEYFRNKRDYDSDPQNYEYQGEEHEFSYENMMSQKVTLQEHLLLQLEVLDIPEVDRKVGTFIIESLDDNGYLKSSKYEIASILNVDRDQITRLLRIIQGFDPSGVGARSLRECLLIQLKLRGEVTSTVKNIILEDLRDLATNRFAVIAKKRSILLEEVQRIGDLLKTLEPKPGRGFSSPQVRYIFPDVFVDKVNGEYITLLNDTASPRLQINDTYQQMLKNPDRKDVSEYLSKRLQIALLLIKNIEQRRTTLDRIVRAIVAYQKDFLEKGVMFLRPLNLKRIAEETDVHESTVCRAISGKFVQTPRGTFELKYFFSSGVTDIDGEGISSESVKKRIREIVDGENAIKPLSDIRITEILRNEGIDISRRTVAKYREEMNIPSSQGRKRYT